MLIVSHASTCSWERSDGRTDGRRTKSDHNSSSWAELRWANNPTITAFVCFQKFPGTFKALCLLLLSEQMRYPPSANLSQVQTLFQNFLHTAFWYASTTSYILDRQLRILFDHNLYSRDVSLDNRGFRPSMMVSSSTENFPALKALTHLKTVRIELVWGPYIPHSSLNICFNLN